MTQEQQPGIQIEYTEQQYVAAIGIYSLLINFMRIYNY